MAIHTTANPRRPTTGPTATQSSRRRVVVALIALLGACAHGASTAPIDVNALSVSATVNVPAAPVMLYGHTLVDRMIGNEPVTLERVMRADAEGLLAERGFTVRQPGEGGVPVPVLEIEVTHWQPDEPQRRWVLVSVAARLRDAPGNDAGWSYRRERWMVPTRDATDSYRMQRIAAYKVVTDVLAGWRQPRYSEPAPPAR